MNVVRKLITMSRINAKSTKLLINAKLGLLKDGGSNDTSNGIVKQLNVARTIMNKSQLVLACAFTLIKHLRASRSFFA